MLTSKNIQDIYKLSPLQEGIYFHSLLEENALGYFSQVAYRYSGPLTLPLVEKSLNVLVQRHDILRTVFNHKKSDAVLQVVLRQRDADFGTEDLRQLPGPRQLAFLASFREQDRQRGFDLTRDPLMRVKVFRLADAEYEFVWSYHHVLMDGWCTSVLLQEYSHIYGSLSKGRQPVLPYAAQYKSFITWLEKQNRDDARQYWTGYVAGFEQPTGIPSLQRPALAGKSYENRDWEWVLPAGLTDGLNQLAEQYKVTVNALMRAVWGIVLGRYNDTQDVVFGAVATIRPAEIAGVEYMLGLLINTVPVRVNYSEETPFIALASALQEQNLEQGPYQYFSLAEIQALSPVKQRLVDHTFIFENYPLSEQIGEAPAGNQPREAETALSDSFSQTNYDLNVIFLPGRQLLVRLNYNGAVYETPFITRLGGHLQSLIQQVIAQPERPVSAYSLLSRAEEDELLGLCGPAVAYPRDAPLNALVEAWVGATPQATALVDGDVRLTYAQLDGLAGTLAFHLVHRAGIAPGDCVAVCLDRSYHAVIALLAIAKAGGTYLPLEPATPIERIKGLLHDTGATVVIARPPHTDQPFGPGVRVVGMDEALREAAPPTYTPPVRASAKSPAYVIYTSGTSGTPKGVPIRHESIVDRVKYHIDYLNVTPADKVLSFASVAFDASIVEMLMGLGAGATLVVAGPPVKENTGLLVRLLAEEGVTVAIFPPAYIKLLARDALPSVRAIISTGEAILMPEALHYARTKDLYNGYGPTEACIGASFHKVDVGRAGGYHRSGSIPIGKPFANTAVYVMDSRQRLLPKGVTGEICVAGVGLTEGYLQKPDLNAEKFLPNPAARRDDEKTLYRTGDRGRWTEDGELEYAGRLDEQIQVRGIRVEPSEIAWRTRQIEGVQDVFVHAVQGAGETRLVAYVVGTDQVNAEGIRDYLLEQLPAYMVPGQVVVLESLPLTPNGKVDRLGLPLPQDQLPQQDFLPPASPAQQALCLIVAALSAKPAVGLQDDFFRLGGDSIKAIQLVSRLYRQGYLLQVSQVFRFPRLLDLAQQVQPLQQLPPQLPVSGPVALTPIQHAFFELALKKPHHYNQSVLLDCPQRIELPALTLVLQALLDHHDALRMCFSRQHGRWQQLNQPQGLQPSLRVVDLTQAADLSGQPRWQDQLRAHCQQEHESFRLEEGPLLRALLLRCPDRDRLLVVVHHLVVDGVSWRILLEDFKSLYPAACAKQNLLLPPKTDSYQRWAQQLTHYAQSPAMQAQRQYWLSQQWPRQGPLAKPLPQGSESRLVQLLFSLSPQQTSQLLLEAPLAYGNEPQEVLLAGLGLSIGKLWDCPKVLLLLEGHGRQEVLAGVNVSRTVGWFTSLYPYWLSCQEPAGRQLVGVKESLRAVPDQGLGYGIVRYLQEQPNSQDESHPQAERSLPAPSVVFNYWGQFQEADGGEDWQISQLDKGEDTAGGGAADGTLKVSVMVAAGVLSVRLQYQEEAFEPVLMERWAQAYRQSLLDLVDHCLSRPHTTLTPADLTFKGLSIPQLESLQADTATHLQAAVQDVYTLSPMQEGMLFQSLVAPLSDAYHYQVTYRIKGALDPALVEKSMQALVARHDILRTVFYHQLTDRPVQVVLRERSPAVAVLDVSGYDGAGQSAETEAFLQRDRATPFDLGRGVLVRIAVVKSSPADHLLVWTSHHILMDGWCMGVLMSEFVALYAGFARRAPLHLPAVKPFSSYIQWLEKQDAARTVQYWQEYLAGYHTSASFLKDRPVTGQPAEGFAPAAAVARLSRQETRELKDLSRQLGVTPGNFIQALWGVLLARHTRARDVVFGKTVSGRPGEVAGIETMTGLFINTVPVRVRYDAQTTFAGLFRQVQEDAVAAETHQYCSLARVQAASPLKQQLLDHVIVFENLPPATAAAADGFGVDWEVEDVRAYKHTQYDLVAIIHPTDELSLKLEYNALVYSESLVRQLLDRFGELTRNVLGNPHARVAETPVVDAAELRLMRAFNQTRFDFPARRTMVDLFEEQVDRRPGAAAVAHGDARLTYAALDDRANRFAHYLLTGYGLQRGEVVAFRMERSADLLTVMLAIMKTGAVYLPIDRNVPPERVAYVLRDSGARAVVTDAPLPPAAAVVPAILFAQVDLSRLPAHRPGVPIAPEAALYLIYTSGSTGTPKGVLIPHRALTNYACAIRQAYGFGPQDRSLLLSSVAFDLSYTSIWPALAAGSELFILPETPYVDVEALLTQLVGDRITLLKTTPTLFNLLVNAPGFARLAPSLALRLIFLGGEKIKPRDLEQYWQAKGHDTLFVNHYGPTETTVGVITQPVAPRPGTGEGMDIAAFRERPVIGKPIFNAQAWVLDGDGQPAGMGMAGELCIGGPGLALGYLHQPGLTAEKFIASPFAPGQRLYRTGDLARWLPGGVVEYIGRMDDQVKIKGYRVEPGEIEQVMRTHPHVADAVVVARLQEGHPVLVGYLVPAAPLDPAQLRQYLKDRLPDYMVPAHLVAMEAFPLIENGKTDRNALPPVTEAAPAPVAPTEVAVAPAAPAEVPASPLAALVAEVFAKVLGVKQVRPEDDFFAIGGDSIRALQIVSRLYREGYRLEVRDLFNYPLIGQVTARVQPRSRLAEQGVITGAAPLTPIQHAFFARNLAQPHHYNQALLLHSEARFDEAILRRVFTRIQRHHDALRTRFERTPGGIRQVNQGDELPLALTVSDYRGLPDGPEQMAAEADRLQAGFDLATGPLMQVAVFRLDDGDRLLLAVHHLVVDGVSFRILMEDLGTLYAQAVRGEILELPLKTDSFQYWAERLVAYANSTAFRAEVPYWKKLLREPVPPLPPTQTTPPTPFPATAVRMQLDADDTARLLTGVNQAYGTTIKDILLAALGLAVREVFLAEKAWVMLEGHGREEVLPGVNVSRTVGWFTAMYPVLLSCHDHPDLSVQLKATKETLHQVPHEGIGYGLLAHLSDPEFREQVPFVSPQIVFNYLGQFDRDVENTALRVAEEPHGHTQDPAQPPQFELSVVGMITGGRLQMDFRFDPEKHAYPCVEELCFRYQYFLKRLIGHCAGKEERERTPSDFGYHDLSVEDLDAINSLFR